MIQPFVTLKGALADLSEDMCVCFCYNASIGSSREIYAYKNVSETISERILNFETVTRNLCCFLKCQDWARV